MLASLVGGAGFTCSVCDWGTTTVGESGLTWGIPLSGGGGGPDVIAMETTGSLSDSDMESKPKSKSSELRLATYTISPHLHPVKMYYFLCLYHLSLWPALLLCLYHPLLSRLLSQPSNGKHNIILVVCEALNQLTGGSLLVGMVSGSLNVGVLASGVLLGRLSAPLTDGLGMAEGPMPADWGGLCGQRG